MYARMPAICASLTFVQAAAFVRYGLKAVVEGALQECPVFTGGVGKHHPVIPAGEVQVRNLLWHVPGPNTAVYLSLQGTG